MCVVTAEITIGVRLRAESLDVDGSSACAGAVWETVIITDY